MKQRISQIVFDRKGGEYGDIPRRGKDHWSHVSVHDGMRLGLNVDGLPPNIWINVVSVIFAARLGLVQSAICLGNVMRFLVAALNPVPTTHALWPDARLILEVIKSTPSDLWASKADYLKTLINSLEGLVQQSGEFLQTFRGLDVNRDIIDKGKSVVIDMANLSPPALRSIAIDLILAQILLLRIHQRHRVDATEVVVVVDEADQDVSQRGDAAFPDGISTIGQMLKLGRELGIMAVIGQTVLTGTSRYVLSGPQYHLLFDQQDAASMSEARQTLALPMGAEQMFPALKPGQCIFRQAQSSWSHPMLSQVDFVPPDRTTQAPHYDTHPYVPSKRLAELPHVQEAVRNYIAQHMKQKARQAQSYSAGVSKKARTLLDLATLHEFEPVARLWERVDTPSPSVQRAARKQLEDFAFAEFEEVRIGKTNVLLIRALPAGWKFLQKTPPSRTGRGGIAHCHFAHWIAEVEKRRGFKSVCEWNVPVTNHPVDVASRHGETWHVFEVCVTCIDNVLSHVEACLGSADVSQVTIVTPQIGQRKKIKKLLPGELFLGATSAQISFEVVEPYMKELFR